MVSVKICGVRTVEMAQAVRGAEADFAGLLFVPGRRRSISVEKAKALIGHLGAVNPVAVFLNESVDRMIELCEELGLHWVQLHGQEPPSVSAALSERGLKVVRAISIDHLPLPVGFLRPYEAHVATFLLDGMKPGSGQIIPSDGTTHDVRDLTDRPVWLAGGLNPDNVLDRIQQVGADGADVASGVEGSDGQPSTQKIVRFVKQARKARGT